MLPIFTFVFNMFSGMVRKCLVLHPASRKSHWILNKYKDPSSFNAIRSWGHMLFFYSLVCLTFMFIPYKVLPPLWKVFNSSPFFKTSLLLILVLSNATAPQIAVNFSPSYTHTHDNRGCANSLALQSSCLVTSSLSTIWNSLPCLIYLLNTVYKLLRASLSYRTWETLHRGWGVG